MGKKVEKVPSKDKHPSTASQDDTESNKALEPHVCNGHFQTDFSELCRRSNMTYIPPVVLRGKPPNQAPPPDANPVKGGKDKGKQQAPPQPEVEAEEVTEDGDPVDPPPKTFTTKDKFEYFKPSIQVEMDNPDKIETVTEIFIRGWKIDAVMMDIFRQCWATMDKLHTVNLWNTGLTSETVSILASFLPNCPALKTLILDGNGPLTDENWFELITDESPLQNLSLRHCAITDKGAVMIGRTLGTVKKSNQKLLTLNLSNNKIGDKGLDEIAQGLRMNRTLLSLSLASNQIGDKGALNLAEVLSRFPLSHEEVVERRRQQSDRASPDRNKSPEVERSQLSRLQKNVKNAGGRKSFSHPATSRRAESRDRPGSVRSTTQPDKKGKSNEKSAKGKKDGKGGKDDKDDKHDKGKGGKKDKEDKAGKKGSGSNLTSRGSGASIIAESAKPAKGGKGGKQGKDKGKPPAAEQEQVSESPELINPLLEGADFIDGQLWVSGNRILINLNLSRNQIGELGMQALLKSMEHQQRLDTKTNGTGLMRLLLGKNKISADHGLVHELNDIMLPKDPFYKPPSQSPEGTEA